jgi:hypothetical protein
MKTKYTTLSEHKIYHTVKQHIPHCQTKYTTLSEHKIYHTVKQNIPHCQTKYITLSEHKIYHTVGTQNIPHCRNNVWIRTCGFHFVPVEELIFFICQTSMLLFLWIYITLWSVFPIIVQYRFLKMFIT